MRFGSVPYKNKPKFPTGSDGGIFKSSTICWAAMEGREAKCPAGRRTFLKPRCSTCELLSGRVRMSRRGSTVTDFTVGHVVKMEVVTPVGSLVLLVKLLAFQSAKIHSKSMFHRSSVRMVCFRSLPVLRSASFLKQLVTGRSVSHIVSFTLVLVLTVLDLHFCFPDWGAYWFLGYIQFHFFYIQESRQQISAELHARHKTHDRDDWI